MRQTQVILLGLIAWLTAGVDTGRAQEKKDKKGPGPEIVVAMPMAVDPGATTKIVVRGLALESVTGVRMHEPKSTARVISKGKKVPVPANGSPKLLGDSEIEIAVTLSKEVAGGAVPFSLIGPGGESKPHRLIVKDDTPIVVEKEPNDGFKQAQPIPLPCIVEGSIRQPQDVDVFRVEGKKGDQLVFELQANRFGSPLDGILALYDERGAVVASTDASDGSLDPLLRITLLQSGPYYLSLIDAHDQGGSIFIYRLVCRRAN